MLLGCLSNSPVDAAQLPAASEEEQPVPHSGQASNSTVPQKTPPPPALPVFQTEVLVTAERGTAPRDESAGAAAVLTRADIGRLPGHSLPALIAFLPGFHVLFGADFAGTPMIQSRGFFGGGEAEYVQLLVDGVPVSDAESGLVDWRRFRSWDIERIEARRGPSSSLYGDTSLGGVIQILTRTDVPRGGVRVTGGRFGALSVDAGVSRKLAAATATLTATGSRTNGFRSHSTAREGALTAALEGGESARRWSARVAAETRNQQEPGPRSRAELETERFGSDPMFRSDGETTRRARTSVEYSHARDSFSLSVMGHAAVRDAQRTRTLLLAPGMGTQAARSLSTTTGGATLRVEQHGMLFGGSTASRLGAELVRDRADTRYVSLSAADADSRGTRLRVGAYVSEAWNMTERFRLSGGVRYDRITDRFAGSTAGHTQHEAWSPRVGLVYEIARGDKSATSVFFQAARAFKAPTLDQLFDPRPFPDFAGGTFVISSPGLRPQRASNLEAGLRHSSGASRVEIVAYRMRVTDEIDFDPLSFTYGNIGRTLHTGIEAELRWRRFARVSPSLAYAWTRVEPTAGEISERQLKNIPRHLWKPSLMVELPGGMDATIAYTGTAGRFLDDRNEFPLNDISSFDVRLAKRFRRVLTTVDLLNVTGDDYEELGFALTDFGGQSVPYYFPGHGFAARAGFELRF
jgi:outer membrane receptor protein involved in Fe transport